MNSLKRVRIENALTLEAAAKNINIPSGYLSQIEKGERTVTRERAADIASFYGVDIDKLFEPVRFKSAST